MYLITIGPSRNEIVPTQVCAHALAGYRPLVAVVLHGSGRAVPAEQQRLV
jgi:hypothetical protein